jgi:hypothetical protein
LPFIEKRNSKRTSAITQTAPSSSSVVEVNKPQASHRGSNYTTTKIAFENVAEEEETNVKDVDEDELDSASCVKRMKVEMTRLIEDNHNLLSDQFTRESEIRNEVSLEMATRSAQLLDQLQDLQSQLDGKEYQVVDIKRSCKKVRRKQLDQANYDAVQDLQEAEEELERVKIAYELEIDELKEDKRLLEEELALFKEKFEELNKVELTATASSTNNSSSSEVKSTSSGSNRTSASSLTIHAAVVPEEVEEVKIVAVPQDVEVITIPECKLPRTEHSISSSSSSTTLPKTKSSAIRSKVSTSSVIHDENEESRKISVADEFSQRMQRDQRFKKNDTETSGPSSVKHPMFRSPLAPHDTNSPSKLPVPWEKSLRETSRPNSPIRFDTSAEVLIETVLKMISYYPIMNNILCDVLEHKTYNIFICKIAFHVTSHPER